MLQICIQKPFKILKIPHLWYSVALGHVAPLAKRKLVSDQANMWKKDCGSVLVVGFSAMPPRHSWCFTIRIIQF